MAGASSGCLATFNGLTATLIPIFELVTQYQGYQSASLLLRSRPFIGSSTPHGPPDAISQGRLNLNLNSKHLTDSIFLQLITERRRSVIHQAGHQKQVSEVSSRFRSIGTV